MAYTPKLSNIAVASALIFCINPYVSAESDTVLSPVVITGEKGTGYVAKSAMIAGPGGTQETQLKDIPTSVTVITKDFLDDKHARTMSDAVRSDASVGDYYAPVGYYENLYIRGFPLDLATSYRINGMSATGEQNIAFENKERLEILKGVGAMQAGAASPGGLVNFVTKRPKEVSSATVGLSERGTRYAAVDYGNYLGESKSLGFRINAATEDYQPYVKNAKGERNFFSLAADAKIDNKTNIQFDIEYQKKKQLAVPGLMLLGDTALPNVKADIMLSHYHWVLPTEIKSLNTAIRVNHEINNDLKMFVNLSRSQAKINDRIAYPYGSDNGNGYTFGSNGDFDVYDFRSDGELRRNDQLQLGFNGSNIINNLKHNWTLGISELKRIVEKGSSVYGSDPNSLARNGYDNIYSLNSNISPSTYSTGPIFRILDHSQTSLFGHDQINLTERIKLFLGLRAMNMRQTAYDVYTGTEQASLNKNWLLPQIGTSYKITNQLTTYISYSEGVEPGTIALPDSFRNSRVLDPKKTKQIEIGSKFAINPDSLLTFAAFQAKRPNEFATNYGSDFKYDYVQEGHIKNTGFEASLSQKITKRLNILASMMYVQAKQSGASDSLQNGAQAIGIPKIHTTAYADYLLPDIENMSIQGGWTYTSSKGITLDNSIKAPGYSKFDAGIKYVAKVGGTQSTYRLYVENILNKFYWRDVSQSFGSNTLYPGAPRLFRATATFDF